MSTAILAVQKAIYAILTGDVTLMAKVSGVFDFIPDKEPFPYVQIGDAQYQAFDTHTRNGVQGDITLHVFSRARGRAETLGIQADLYRLLHLAALTVPNFSLISLRFDFQDVLVDPDAVTYHGVQRFKIILGGN